MLGNGAVALRYLEGLPEQGLPALVMLNAPERQAIRGLCQRRGVPVETWSDVSREALIARCAAAPDLWLLSVYFGHILDDAVLDAAGGRAVNLHASLLPWNRGVHTNVWPIVEHTPAGVSLHAMVRGVDRGPLLVQTEVPVGAADTAGTLYERLEAAGLALLQSSWPGKALERWPGTPQPEGGSEHRLKDFALLDVIDLDANPEMRRFFDLLRARSFPPYPGLRVRVGGSEVRATITLSESDG